MIHNQATPPELQPHGVPPQLARVVRRMLSRVPAQRQQTMREVIQDLRTAGRNQKNIPAFASEGTQVAHSGLTTNLLALGDGPVPGAPQTAAPAYPAPAYQAPVQIATPQPSFVPPNSGAQPSYPQPTPVPGYPQPAPPSHFHPVPASAQPGYQQPTPAPSYPQPPAGSSFHPVPPMAQPSYQPAPYRQPSLSEDPMRRARLVRLGEFVLGFAVVIIYLVVYWQDTLSFLRNFAKSLRFGL